MGWLFPKPNYEHDRRMMEQSLELQAAADRLENITDEHIRLKELRDKSRKSKADKQTVMMLEILLSSRMVQATVNRSLAASIDRSLGLL